MDLMSSSTHSDTETTPSTKMDAGSTSTSPGTDLDTSSTSTSPGITHWADILVIVVYFCIVLAIGVYVSI